MHDKERGVLPSPLKIKFGASNEGSLRVGDSVSGGTRVRRNSRRRLTIRVSCL